MQKSNRLLVSMYVVYNSPEVVLKSKLEFFWTFDVSGFGVDGNIIHEWDEMLHESWDSTCCAHDCKIPIYLLASIIASQHWFQDTIDFISAHNPAFPKQLPMANPSPFLSSAHITSSSGKFSPPGWWSLAVPPGCKNPRRTTTFPTLYQ